jgi:hypothetical protein
MSGPYSMTTPCPQCPFRADIPGYLTAGRVRSIERDLIRGEFHCHKTTATIETEDGAERVSTPESIHCAGALILLEKLERPSQMMRISQRLGMYDPTTLDMDAPIFGDFDQMAKAQPR